MQLRNMGLRKMHGAIPNEPLHDAQAQPGNDAPEADRATDAEIRMGSNMSAHPFHTRRLELPEGKGWIEIRGEFNPFDLNEEQRKLIAMMSDWFRQFDREYRAPETERAADERTSHPDPQPASIQLPSIDNQLRHKLKVSE